MVFDSWSIVLLETLKNFISKPCSKKNYPLKKCSVFLPENLFLRRYTVLITAARKLWFPYFGLIYKLSLTSVNFLWYLWVGRVTFIKKFRNLFFFFCQTIARNIILACKFSCEYVGWSSNMKAEEKPLLQELLNNIAGWMQ